MSVVIGLIILFALMSAFFSGIESAYLSTNKLGIEVLKTKGTSRSDILTELYDDPRSFLSNTLLGNTIAVVMLTLLAGPLLFNTLYDRIELPSWALTLIVLLILVSFIFIFCEYLPKYFFRMYASELVYRFAYTLKAFTWLLTIPAYVINKVSGGIIATFTGKAIDDSYKQVSQMDLEHFITNKVADEEDIDADILSNALNLNQLKVKDCMIPRNEIIFVDKSDEIDEIRRVFIESKLSRIIVVDGDIENIVGYLHHQQLFRNITNIKRHILKIDFVPDVMNVQDLFYNFMRTSTNIACVVDEFGGTDGIITLEDILEEIFGDIADEHDDEEFVEKKIDDNTYLFSGRLEISYINEEYELDLPDDEYITLSGYVVMTHGNIPEVGEIITLEDYTFEIIVKSDTKIDLIKMTKQGQSIAL